MNRHLEGLLVHQDATLRDALAGIDRGAIGAVMVVDAAGSVVGMLTDGDVRRALLRGEPLDSPLAPHVRTDFVHVAPGLSRADILDVMQSRYLSHIPVIDEDRRLVHIHTLRGILGGEVKGNWAVIMAGGQGVRLRPLTEQLPKPMITVAGRAILERLVIHLVSYGIRRIFLAVNYLANVIEDHFQDGEKFGCSIEYLRETEPLGSGGALALLPERPTLPVLVMNGDLLTQADLQAMLDTHQVQNNYATMGVRVYRHQVEFGCATLEDSGRICALEEKPIIEKCINAGLYILSPDAAADVPRSFFPITDLFRQALNSGKRCGSYLVESDWIDVGQPSSLAIARGHATS